MHSFTISDSDRGRTLIVTGDVTIQNAADFRESLLELKEGEGDADIDLEGLTEADLTCLQLLCSAHRTFTTSNRRIAIKGRFPEALQKVIVTAGYQRDRGCVLDSTQTCLWVGRITV